MHQTLNTVFKDLLKRSFFYIVIWREKWRTKAAGQAERPSDRFRALSLYNLSN